MEHVAGRGGTEHSSRTLRFGFWWSARLVKGAARVWVCLRLGAAAVLGVYLGSVGAASHGAGGQRGASLWRAVGVCALAPAARTLLRWLSGRLRRVGAGWALVRGGPWRTWRPSSNASSASAFRRDDPSTSSTLSRVDERLTRPRVCPCRSQWRSSSFCWSSSPRCCFSAAQWPHKSLGVRLVRNTTHFKRSASRLFALVVRPTTVACARRALPWADFWLSNQLSVGEL